MTPPSDDDPGKALRNAALATSNAILVVQRRAERELVQAKQALERRTEELARNVSMLHATLDATGSGILAVDLEGGVTLSNEHLARMFRAPPEELDTNLETVLGLMSLQARHPEQFLARAREVHSRCAVEVLDFLELEDGRVLERHVRSQNVDGKRVGTIGNYRDVTERRRTEEQAAQNQRLVALGTLAAGVAHEVNNPLAYVLGNLEFCRDDLGRVATELRRGRTSEDGDEAERCARLVGHVERMAEAMDDACQGAERVRRIVSDLRSLSLQSDGVPTRVDVAEVLRSVTKMMHNTLRHFAQVRVSVADKLFVQVPPGALEQLMTNLLINAAHAIGEGHADTSEIRVTAHDDATGRVFIEVSDDGPGILPTVLPHIFEPFFTTKTIGTGMGLGLSLCHKIVSTAGGHITAENREEGGAMFCVALPAARAASVPVSSSRSLSPSGGQAEAAPSPRGRVLVIDDEVGVATALRRMLSAEHDVTATSDGREALARVARGETYDVILCDLMMPNVSGADVYEAMHETHPAQAERIVFMTGGAFSAKAQELLANARHDCLAKPFDIVKVRSTVRALMK